MSRKQRAGRVVRKTAGDYPPPTPKQLPPGCVRQSPLTEVVETQAQRLIHETGSPSAAKEAVDVAADREHVPDFQEDHFALRWGFASRAQMRAASKPLTDCDGKSWWATALPGGRWVVWNKEHLAASETFESLEAARRSMGGTNLQPR